MVAGSTGEAPLLADGELSGLVEAARRTIDSAPPATASSTPDASAHLIAGCGAESTRRTIELCGVAAARGADAVLVRSPYYYRDQMSPAALHDHFEAVADASAVPVVVYSIPRYVPVELAPELIGRLMEHENVAGVKDSSGDLKTMGAVIEACGSNGAVLAGAGTLLYSALEAGAAGGVVAVGLLATAACVGLVQAFEAGRSVEAGRLQQRIGPLHKAVVGKGGIAGIKAALDLLGLYGGPVRAPLLSASEKDRKKVREALSAAGLPSDPQTPAER